MSISSSWINYPKTHRYLLISKTRYSTWTSSSRMKSQRCKLKTRRSSASWILPLRGPASRRQSRLVSIFSTAECSKEHLPSSNSSQIINRLLRNMKKKRINLREQLDHLLSWEKSRLPLQQLKEKWKFSQLITIVKYQLLIQLNLKMEVYSLLRCRKLWTNQELIQLRPSRKHSSI